MKLLEVVVAMVGGGGQCGSIFWGLDGLLELGEDAIVDGVGGGFGRGRGIVGGRGFDIDGDFGQRWVQWVLEVGPGNNYIEN